MTIKTEPLELKGNYGLIMNFKFKNEDIKIVVPRSLMNVMNEYTVTDGNLANINKNDWNI